MATYPAESFYRGTIRQSIANNTSVPFTLKVSKIPTLTSGLLTISPNTANEEIVEYSGVDGTALTITVVKRGISPSAQSLTVNGTDYNNVTYQKSHSQNDTIRGDVNHLHIIQDYGNLQSQINNKVDTAGGLRTMMGASHQTLEIDATGAEVKKEISDGSSIASAETIRKRKADGTYEEIPYSNIKTDISGHILNSIMVFSRTGILGEDISNITYRPVVKIMTNNTTPSPFVASASQTLSASYEPFYAFDRNDTTGTWLALTNTDNTTDRWIKIDLGTQYNIGRVALRFNDYTAANEWAPGWKIEGSNNDSSWTTLYTGGSSPTTVKINHTFTPGQYRYIRFIGKKNNTTNGTPGLSTFDVFVHTTDPKSMAIVNGAVTYTNTLGSNIVGNRLLSGIRFSVPYNTTLGVVKTTQLSTSSSARIQLLDDAGALIAEQTPTLSTDTVTFPNTPITANTVYRLVVNDNANFGNNSNELALASYQTGFQFILSGTLNSNNSVEPQQIREIQLGTTKIVQATAGSTAEFAILAGFYSGIGVKGSEITLSANDGQVINFSFLDNGSRYYVSNTEGIIDIYAGTISRIVGAALSGTQIYLSNANYPGTNLPKP